MLELTKGNIRIITEIVDKAEISFSHLRDDLIDHICCEIEQEMQKGNDFQNALLKIKKNTGISDLQSVQEQTLLLINKNYCVMKNTMKISGIISTSLLMLASLFKLNHWPGAGILLVLGFFVLCMVFLPSANYVMHKERKDKSMIFLFISAFLGSSGYFAGILFKIMHWPGAGIVMLAGIAILILLFFPSLLVYLLKISKSSKEQRIYSIGVLSGILYLFGFLSKIMNWPGATLLISISSLLLVFVFIPTYSIFKYREEKSIKGSFIYLIVAFTWFSVFSVLISLSISKPVINSYIDEGNSLQSQIEIIEKINNDLLMSGFQNGFHDQSQQIDQQVSELVLYIEKTKVDIIREMNADNHLAIKQDNVIDLKLIHNVTDKESASKILLGQNMDGNAFEISARLEEINLLFQSLINEDQNSHLINDLLHTTIPDNSSVRTDKWEVFQFKGKHVIACMNILTGIERNIRLAEYELLSYLYKKQ